MSWTKGQLVDEAWGELALAGYNFDISPDEKLMTLRRLEAMMATWNAKGIKLGYVTSSSPSSADLNTPSGIPDSAVEPVYANLARRIAAPIGKQLLPSTIATATEGYATLLWAAAQPPQQQLPDRLPRGAGNKPWRINDQPFFAKPDPSPLTNSDNGGLDILE